ncbi:MAG: hypothetical protein ACYS6W_02560 [Planctomycetota bacterium]|jgi:hypothetical protein
MKQNVRNDGEGANRFYSRLVAEKKKGILALCLIAVMGFMWVRVLLRKTPRNAEATARREEAGPDTSDSNSQLKISFIDLPEVAGRNDVLTKDFFAANGWQDFIDGKNEVSVVSRDDDEERVKRVAEIIKLEAIRLGENPQAFINDKLLSVGDKLLVVDGADTHECEVVGIEEKTVFIKFGEAEITKELTQASTTDY